MAKNKDTKFSNLSSAANVLQSLLKSSKSPLSEQFTRWRLWQDWEAVVGQEMAKHSMPVGFLSGTLYIWVNSAARMQEMMFLVRSLRQKINQFAGKEWVRSIRFTLDQKLVQPPNESSASLHNFLAKDKLDEE